MGARRIFSRGEQWGGLKDICPQRGSGGEPRWRWGGKPPEAEDIFLKYRNA